MGKRWSDEHMTHLLLQTGYVATTGPGQEKEGLPPKGKGMERLKYMCFLNEDKYCLAVGYQGTKTRHCITHLIIPMYLSWLHTDNLREGERQGE